jgi:hypothetical protein
MFVGAATMAFVRGRHGLGAAAVVVAVALVGGLFIYGQA